MTDAPLHYVARHADELDRNGAPMPVPNDGPSMHDLVAADIAERKAFGLARYGSLLQAHNGRDALQDAYEELLDLLVYLRQLMVERDAEPPAEQPAVDRRYDTLHRHLVLFHGASPDDPAAGTELIQRHLNAHRFGRGVAHGYEPWGGPL